MHASADVSMSFSMAAAASPPACSAVSAVSAVSGEPTRLSGERALPSRTSLVGLLPERPSSPVLREGFATPRFL